MLIVVFALALPFTMQDTPECHARPTERSILALHIVGIARPATFRDLIATSSSLCTAPGAADDGGNLVTTASVSRECING